MSVNLLSDEDAVQQRLDDIKTGKAVDNADPEMNDQDFDTEDPVEDDEEATPESHFEDVDDDDWGKPKPKPQEEEKVELEEEKAKQPDAKQLAEDLELIRKLIDTGEESIGKVKGQEVDFSQLTPQERLALQQKGWRFYQFMEELAQKEDQLRAFEGKLSQDARTLINLKQTGQLPGQPTPQGGATVPDELQDDEYDDPKTKAVKAVARGLWDRVSRVEQSDYERNIVQGERELLTTIDSLKETYPMLSPEEIIAVRALYDDIPIERIAQRSHKQYSSVDHVDRVFTHCPDVKKHFRDKFVNDFIASKNKRQTIPQKPSGSVRREVAETKPKRKGLDFDFDDAEANIRKGLRALKTIHDEEEFE